MCRTKSKRKRFISVCTNCKTRKTKCDRAAPCSNCEKLKIQSTCQYTYGEKSELQPYILSANKPVDMSAPMQISRKEGKIKGIVHTKNLNGPLSRANCHKNSLKTNSDIDSTTYRYQRVNCPPQFIEGQIEENSRISAARNNAIHPSLATTYGSNPSNEVMTTKAYMLNHDPITADRISRMRGKSYYESLIGINPYIGSEDTILFHRKEDYHDSCPPSLWIATVNNDFALKILWNEYLGKPEVQGNVSSFISDDPESKVSSSKYKHCIIALSGKNDKKKKDLSDDLLLLQADLKRELLQVLPSQSVVWTLIERFFCWVYPYVPFLDERVFKSDISRILCYNSGGSKDLNIFRCGDYASLGLLVIVLRFSYLSFFSNSSPESAIKTGVHAFLEEEDLVLGPQLIEVSLKCMRMADFAKDDDFSTFLLAFFIKLYYKYSPEGISLDDGRDVKEVDKILIERARVIGLNEERSSHSFFQLSSDYLKGKIWSFLIMSDLSLGYSYGLESSISHTCLTVNPPIFDEQRANLLNVHLDHEVSKFFFLSSHLTPSLSQLLLVVSQKDGCKVGTLCNIISTFEKELNHEFGPLSVSMYPVESDVVIKTFKRQFALKSHFAFTSFLISAFWNLFSYFESTEPNFAMHYLKKALSLIFEILSYFPELLSQSRYSCDFIINPSIEKFVHRSNQIIIALAFRMSLYKYAMEVEFTDPDQEMRDYFRLMREVHDGLLNSVNSSISALSCFSSTYTNTKRLIKVGKISIESISDPTVIQRGYHEIGSEMSSPRFPCFTHFQLSEILSMISSSHSGQISAEMPSEGDELDLRLLELDFELRDNLLDFVDFFDL